MRFVELFQCGNDRVFQTLPFAVGRVDSFSLCVESAETIHLIEVDPHRLFLQIQKLVDGFHGECKLYAFVKKSLSEERCLSSMERIQAVLQVRLCAFVLPGPGMDDDTSGESFPRGLVSNNEMIIAQRQHRLG